MNPSKKMIESKHLGACVQLRVMTQYARLGSATVVITVRLRPKWVVLFNINVAEYTRPESVYNTMYIADAVMFLCHVSKST